MLALSMFMLISNMSMVAQPTKRNVQQKPMPVTAACKKMGDPKCTLPPRPNPNSLANLASEPEYSLTTQKIYQAAKQYNEQALRSLLQNSDRQSQEKMLLQAMAYADHVSHDAQTSRSLTEALIQTRKSWLERYHPFTTVLIPLAAAMAGAMIFVVVDKFWQGPPKGGRPRGSTASNSVVRPQSLGGDDEL